MLKFRLNFPSLAAALVLAAGLQMAACSQGDVGAPCNHGSVEAPSSKLVTFPALSCSDLLCVYGEEKTVPETPCAIDTDCGASGDQIFECVILGNGIGECRLRLDYVLERSMCSKTCETNDDCNNTSLGNRPTVDDDETACMSGFSCVVLQRLGEFCCEKLCVCSDDLENIDSTLEAECEPNIGEAWLNCPDNQTQEPPTTEG